MTYYYNIIENDPLPFSLQPTDERDIKASRMKWSESIGLGYVQWCILIAEANKICHPDMTDAEILTGMRTRAEQGTISHNDKPMGEVVMAVIDELQISNMESSVG